jgi:predicted permease
MGPIRHTLRGLLRTPTFTAVALLTLAIGVGANTAVFSVVNGVLLKPLPYPDAGELVGVWHAAPGINIPGNRLNCSPTMFFTYRDQNRAFESFGVWTQGGAAVTGLAEPEQVPVLRVTSGALDALAVPPALGRWFSEQDDSPGTPETVMLMHGYWQRRFGGAADIVGRGLTLDGRPREIIGVMPEAFRFLNVNAELIVPLRFDRSQITLGNFSFSGLARLKPGVTIAAADADVSRMLPLWLKGWPVPPGFDAKIFESARIAPALQPLKRDVVGDIANVLWVLMGTIGLVLLIACANVANLLLVRAEGRQQERAIRAALGAGWDRLAREMLLESLVLGLLGGALGVGVAYASVRVLVAVAPATLPRADQITIDPYVLAFAVAASLVSGVLFGLIPALKHASPRIVEGLRGGGRTASQSRERHRARNTLVVVQVALALVLLVGSGLMIRSFQALRAVRPGFVDPATVQLVRIVIPEAQVQEPERVSRMQQDIRDRIAAIAGVSAAAYANSAPIEPFNSNDVLFVEHQPYPEGRVPPIRRFKFIGPGFFEALGLPLLTGRDLTWTDLYDYRPVAVVSENLARELWQSPSAALGKRIRESAANPWREVVGVVGNLHDNGVDEEAPAIVFYPTLMRNFWGNPVQVQRALTFTIRSARTGTEGFLDEVRRAVWAANANLPLAQVRSLQEVYERSMARTSFTLAMLIIAAGMALLLGVVGIYGVISYAVTERTREIGIRLALGAQHAALKRMFVRSGLGLATIGVVCGLAAAAGVTRLMSTLLYGVGAIDPATYAAVSLALVLAAAVASYIPARRATAVDPIESLRAD